MNLGHRLGGNLAYPSSFARLLTPPPSGAGASALQAALRGSLAGAGVGHASCSSYPEYFQAILPGGVRLVRAFTRQERLPLNLGREVLAGLVGDPGRADWKVCTQSEEQVATAAEAFKAAFGPYDPSGPA